MLHSLVDAALLEVAVGGESGSSFPSVCTRVKETTDQSVSSPFVRASLWSALCRRPEIFLKMPKVPAEAGAEKQRKKKKNTETAEHFSSASSVQDLEASLQSKRISHETAERGQVLLDVTEETVLRLLGVESLSLLSGTLSTDQRLRLRLLRKVAEKRWDGCYVTDLATELDMALTNVHAYVGNLVRLGCLERRTLRTWISRSKEYHHEKRTSATIVWLPRFFRLSRMSRATAQGILLQMVRPLEEHVFRFIEESPGSIALEEDCRTLVVLAHLGGKTSSFLADLKYSRKVWRSIRTSLLTKGLVRSVTAWCTNKRSNCQCLEVIRFHQGLSRDRDKTKRERRGNAESFIKGEESVDRRRKGKREEDNGAYVPHLSHPLAEAGGGLQRGVFGGRGEDVQDGVGEEEEEEVVPVVEERLGALLNSLKSGASLEEEQALEGGQDDLEEGSEYEDEDGKEGGFGVPTRGEDLDGDGEGDAGRGNENADIDDDWNEEGEGDEDGDGGYGSFFLEASVSEQMRQMIAQRGVRGCTRVELQSAFDISLSTSSVQKSFSKILRCLVKDESICREGRRDAKVFQFLYFDRGAYDLCLQIGLAPGSGGAQEAWKEAAEINRSPAVGGSLGRASPGGEGAEGGGRQDGSFVHVPFPVLGPGSEGGGPDTNILRSPILGASQHLLLSPQLRATGAAALARGGGGEGGDGGEGHLSDAASNRVISALAASAEESERAVQSVAAKLVQLSAQSGTQSQEAGGVERNRRGRNTIQLHAKVIDVLERILQGPAVAVDLQKEVQRAEARARGLPQSEWFRTPLPDRRTVRRLVDLLISVEPRVHEGSVAAMKGTTQVF
eukprot:Cvel_18113.t1-p1 / transcript=Cvel_18113.t1 / gene=Cvel_18113 / organism=Chromera_velia_CCMP2878 / gene_product=hypothetical protein / transcript_product=hypothetical protein / location=Cvel_scaffold1485:33741-44625(+) / protein_length=841 / sequence_SO=supercontig / SO=protein_coding / is_pseudo=false